MPLFLVLLAVPLIEIALFIQIGGLIGLWPTLAIVVLTAAAGAFLLRREGSAELAKLRGQLNALEDPSETLVSGMLIAFAGALLLTPGFFTDASGLLLMVPGVRRAIYARFRDRMSISTAVKGPTPGGHRDTVIDGDFEDVTPRREGPSGWTRP